MKFDIEKDALRKALDQVKLKGCVETVKRVLISGKGKEVFITGSDGTDFIRKKIPAVGVSGKAIQVEVDLKGLQAAAKGLPSGTHHLCAEAESITLDYGRGTMTVKSEDNPGIAELPEAESFITIPAADLKAMISKTRHAVTDDVTKNPALHYAFLHIVKRGRMLRMVGTDGHRLAYYEKGVTGGDKKIRAALKEGLMISRNILDQVDKALGKKPAGDVRIGCGKKDPRRVFIEYGDTVATCLSASPTYPDYEKVIKIQENTSATVARNMLGEAVARAKVSVASIRHSDRAVVLEVNDDGLTFSVDKSSAAFKMNEAIAATHLKGGSTIRINNSYLEKALREVDTKNVKIAIDTPERPVTIRSASDPGHFQIIMPMRA